jgi:hypothetical protein
MATKPGSRTPAQRKAMTSSEKAANQASIRARKLAKPKPAPAKSAPSSTPTRPSRLSNSHISGARAGDVRRRNASLENRRKGTYDSYDPLSSVRTPALRKPAPAKPVARRWYTGRIAAHVDYAGKVGDRTTARRRASQGKPRSGPRAVKNALTIRKQGKGDVA